MDVYCLWFTCLDIRMVDFVCWIAVVALAAAFVLSLAVKWDLLEWLQVHAPNEFFGKLFNCKFCCSFWVCVLISLTLCVTTGHWVLLAVPICSTLITRELW